MTRHSEHTRRIIVAGQVQGVGFRPFVYRLASEIGLSGSVCNTGDGVRIEVTGFLTALEEFIARIRCEAPARARINTLSVSEVPLERHDRVFSIQPSLGVTSGSGFAMFTPDSVPCEACRAEMCDPANRRFLYPFTNCTQCGPRFTITRDVPYDRPATSMACFSLCADCAREYADPADRRFHAQPNACPVCGPGIWLERPEKNENRPIYGDEAFRETITLIERGAIVALKGVGGFQLACDARSQGTVARLRLLKHRPHKPFALMAGSLETARRVVHLDREEEKQLEHPTGPVVLCRMRDTSYAHIAPDSDELGILLPSSPLHMRIFAELEKERKNPAEPLLLVMTSGNRASAPMCISNREALSSLAGIADAFLFHDRDIVARADDSVLRVVTGPSVPFVPSGPSMASGPSGLSGTAPSVPLSGSRLCCPVPGKNDARRSVQMIRRARGYVPQAVELAESGPPVFAWGADLKNTVCVIREKQAFVSQHVGDTQDAQTLAFMDTAARHVQNLVRARPEAMACELHPDSLAARHAEQAAGEAGIPLYRLQHHFAHGYAVLAEHGHLRDPALALMLDGSGYGPDGTVWGGELLALYPDDPGQDTRIGRLRPFALPGGDIAVLEPWRIASAFLSGAGRGKYVWPWSERRAAAEHAVRQIVMNGLGTGTSSCGRLFDAVSACLGLCETITYEGQAAVRLERHAGIEERDIPDLARHGMPISHDLLREESGLLELDGHAIFHEAAEGVMSGCASRLLARRFHTRLAAGFARMAGVAKDRLGLHTIALGGGVMLNRAFSMLLEHFLAQAGFTVLRPSLYPPGDGAVSLGQAVWLRQKLQK